MNVKHTNAPEFEAMVEQRLLNAPDQKAECLDLIQTVIRATEQATEQATGQPDHSPLDPSYILGEYTALAKATLKRIYQEDSTRTWRQEAPPLDSPDDGKLAQAEYTALKATMKRIHQEDSTKTWIQEAPPPDSPDDGKPVNEHSFRLLISHVDGHATALLVCLKCQHVLMDTGPGHDTDTPEGLRCDHTNRQPLMDYLGEDRTEDLEQ